jgi:hypothetical protein
MEVWDLVSGLSAAASREMARERLVSVGAVAVVPVLAALRNGVVPWRAGVDVLRRVGLDGFGGERAAVAALVEAVVAAPSADAVRGTRQRRLWSQLVSADRWMRDPLGVPRPPFLVGPQWPYPRWPDPREPLPPGKRSWAPLFLAALTEPAVPPAAGGATQAEREAAQDELTAYAQHFGHYRYYLDRLAGGGDALPPMLAAVRRSGLRQRREALLTQANLGWRHLGARDRAVLRRLLDRLARVERRESLRPDGDWYAVRTGDQAAVLAELELSDPVPVPAFVGTSVWSEFDVTLDGSRQSLGWGAGPQPWERVYVSPTINGWTLVFGVPMALGAQPYHPRQWTPPEVVEEQLVRLSRRFGRACHFHYVDEYEDEGASNQFWLANDGTVTDRYLMESVAELVSDRWVRAGVISGADYRHWLYDDMRPDPDQLPRRSGEGREAWVRRWAERIDDQSPVVDRCYFEPFDCRAVSVALGSWFTPGGTVAGNGVLALTARGRVVGHRGLLPLDMVWWWHSLI